MATFTTSSLTTGKNNQFVYWLIDGRKDWSCVRGKVAAEIGVPDGTPIRLHVGKMQTFGAEHIYHRKRRIQIDNILKRWPSTSRKFSAIKASSTEALKHLSMFG